MTHEANFADLVLHYLQARDRSPAWLARRLGVNHSTVSRWLNQQTRPADPETIVRVADVLGVHAADARQALLVAAGYGYQETAPSGPEGEAAHPTGPDPVPPSSAHPPPFLAPPLPPQGVVGRADLLARLTTLLALEGTDGANVPPVALHGMGGIGKTTLALALAHNAPVLSHFPDGVLWVSLGAAPTIRNLLDDWGRALGVDLFTERDEDACHNRLRSLLHQRRMLLIVDDVWEADHGRRFLVGGAHCRTLITTRESPAAYALATRTRTLQVDVLQPAAALELLARLVPEAVANDEESARLLCARLEYLPLGLTLAGRLLAQEADIPSRMQRLVAALIEERQARLQLVQREERPGMGADQTLSLHSILGLSVERLSPLDRERFALLSVFGGEPLTWDLAAATYLWDVEPEDAEETMVHLLQRGLVMRRDQRYWMHALLADYAGEMLAGLDAA